MSSQNGITIYGKFMTFEEVKNKAEYADLKSPMAVVVALIDYIQAQEKEKVKAQREAFIGATKWCMESGAYSSLNLTSKAKAEAATRYPDPAPTKATHDHITEAQAEHLAQDTGSKAKAMQPQVTRKQIDAAIKKAVELGHFPEFAVDDDIRRDFLAILAAAHEAQPTRPPVTREQVLKILNDNVNATNDWGIYIPVRMDSKEKATDAIMALFTDGAGGGQ